MASIKRGINYLLHNRAQFCDSIVKNYLGWLPDKQYLSLRYRCQMGHWVDWKSPKTFSEKLQWLKVYDRKPAYTTMVDKYAVKKYVAERIGEEYIIPTLGVWDKTNDIDWDSLPEQFVLKTTHGGGGSGVFICKDKSSFNKTAVIEKINSSLSTDIYRCLREWPYKDVPRRIIAEKFMAPVKNLPDYKIYGDKSLVNNDVIDTANLVYEELKDYKFFCFNGCVKFFKVDFGRFVEHHANYYSVDGKLLNYGEICFPPVPDADIKLPDNLSEMIQLAERLAAGTSFLRVDLYNIHSKIYFGELTLYPSSGFTP